MMKLYRRKFEYTTKGVKDIDPVEACIAMINKALPAEHIISIDEYVDIGSLQPDRLEPGRNYCPEWNASPAPGTGSVHAQSRYQCLLSHVITDGTVT